MKLLNIELQSKEKEKNISNDIQGELMEDIMDGVQNIVGVQKAKTILHKTCAYVDETLKKILVQEDAKLDLQRKFEKMILDEHITNLYAPRIIASQVKEL